MQQEGIQADGAAVLDNVINKLQIYMDQNNQTLYGLASKMGFSYQPFYRIITKKHLPTIDSLVMISRHFDCTVAELIGNKVFHDVQCYSTIAELLTQQVKSRIRLYIPYIEFVPLVKKEFFVLEDIPDKHIIIAKPSDNYVFYRTDTIDIDGIFLVRYQDQLRLLNVISISSKYIIMEEEGTEIKIMQSSIKTIAKFFNFLTINDDAVLIGVSK